MMKYFLLLLFSFSAYGQAINTPLSGQTSNWTGTFDYSVQFQCPVKANTYTWEFQNNSDSGWIVVTNTSTVSIQLETNTTGIYYCAYSVNGTAEASGYLDITATNSNILPPAIPVITNTLTNLPTNVLAIIKANLNNPQSNTPLTLNIAFYAPSNGLYRLLYTTNLLDWRTYCTWQVNTPGSNITTNILIDLIKSQMFFVADAVSYHTN